MALCGEDLLRVAEQKFADPEQAIAACTAALEAETNLDGWPFGEDRAVVRGKLLLRLGEQYLERSDDNRAANVESALDAYRRARDDLATKAPVLWARAQHCLGRAYILRVRGERADNLENTIAACEAALTVHTREAFPADWAASLNNLAGAFLQRIRGDRGQNIERAIALFELVLTVRTRETMPFQWALTDNSLALAYCRRIRGDRADNIERAIALLEAALTVYSREACPTDWALTQQGLAHAYKARIRGERADNIERAIAFYEAALMVFTPEAFPIDFATTQHNLAVAYANRVRGARADNMQHAIALLEAIITLHTRGAMPREHLESAHLLGQVLLQQRIWWLAATFLADARETFLLLFGQGLDEAEARGLIELAGALFSNAAYATCELGAQRKAFDLACQGRARLLATALRLQRLNLAPERRQQFERLRVDIREHSRLLDQAAGTERGRALDRLKSLRRELSGLIKASEAAADNIAALTLAEPLVADGGAIVLPVVTDIGGKLFVVAAGSEHPRLVVRDLPELTSERLNTLMRSKDGRDGWLSAFARDLCWRERKQRAAGLVETIGVELWSLFAGRLAEALAELGVERGARLMILPVGALGFLPLGLAQEPSGRRLVEDYDIVYGPSLEALSKAREQIEEPPAPSLAAIVNPSGDLAFTPIEGRLVAAEFAAASRVVLDEHTATPAAALAALRDKSYWHFSTHGTFDLEDARRSALVLKGGTKLSVETLLEAEDLGRPRLVVLSACESGLHDIEHTPEEFVGFPGAFMMMGAAAVLGTLWPVDDRAATLLTARFYELHRRRGQPPASALRQAQLWLRDATRSELAAYAEAAAAQGRLDVAQARQLEAALTGTAAEAVRFFDVMGPVATSDGEPRPNRPDPGNDRPFAHPVYWGGFVLTGL